VTVTGVSTFSGNVTFFLCGPNTSQTLCTSGGTQVGSSKAVTTSGQTVISDAATVTSAGHYCWRAVFSGDSSAGVPGSSDARSSECFQITPRQPTISTSANQTVSLGSAISDSATLSGTANDPDGSAADGTITFTAYGPTATATAVCTTQAYQTTAAVSGDGTYGPVSFTPSTPGFYHWIASYDGDSPNTTSVSGACGDLGERDEVLQLQPAISTAQKFVPNDSATITVASGANDLAGRVVFKMWVNDSNCTGTPDYETPAPGIDITSGTGTGLSRTVVSANSTAYSATGTTFHWVVAYTSSNAGHKNVTSPCGVEHSSITIQNSGTPNP
jgi:hypothetical protein